MSKSRQLKKRGDVVELQPTVKKKKFNANKSGEQLVAFGLQPKERRQNVFEDMECRQFRTGDAMVATILSILFGSILFFFGSVLFSSKKTIFYSIYNINV
jgi:hypothetical protein